MDEVESLKAIIATLMEKIEYLEGRLRLYEHPKNSSNSSIPPSKDENRDLKLSLRKKSGKRSGGQLGHKGHTLEMVSSPTEVIYLEIGTCEKCGANLRNTLTSGIERRQVFDIPPIIPIITEYQSLRKICSCGHCTKSPFPLGIEAPVQYGSGVESMVVYLHTRQYMPFNRIREYFHQVVNLPISEGTIQNILVRMAKKTQPIYEMIKEKLSLSLYVGGDETSVRINRKKGWYWTIQNDSLTLMHCSDNRGFATLEELYPNGLPNTIIGHDAYSCWFKFKAKGHQLCMAHLQRDILYFEQIYSCCHWVTKIKQLFLDALLWKKGSETELKMFDLELSQLLENPPDQKYTLLKPFVKRLIKYKESLFTFLKHPFVPPDNNGSERAIRNVKVKTKISGQFSSIENAQIFAQLRSIIDTAIKNKQPILNVLLILATCGIPE